ncbi:MAG: hypothetical protein OEU90_11485 [Gammaproteobacteria bacterium]|nr:hypothetical protein [Gammaproteobacteria bacterium]MDH3806076.1 hypothetical protein [Gammaproteobacteria bacterium]
MTSSIGFKIISTLLVLAASYEMRLLQAGFAVGDQPVPVLLEAVLIIHAILGGVTAYGMWRASAWGHAALRTWMAVCLGSIAAVAFVAPRDDGAGGMPYYAYLFALLLTLFVFVDYFVRKRYFKSEPDGD